ncbi:hypothetical protein [Ferrimonas balearica]|uniref:hypothetical protein n=1 Tax=Ferrimonas balearica TaxID=44012 RepID=UPI001C99B249|nr:hypothetical protein [Ferrimonas balearica]MBY5991192.1 hypothetical protein [Ferrimonas balearica]
MNLKDILGIVAALLVGLGIFLGFKGDEVTFWPYVLAGMTVIALVLVGALGKDGHQD